MLDKLSLAAALKELAENPGTSVAACAAPWASAVADYYNATVDVEVRQALADYFQGLPIGGYENKIPVAGIYGAVMRVRGVINRALRQPLLDITIALHQVPTLVDTVPVVGGGPDVNDGGLVLNALIGS